MKSCRRSRHVTLRVEHLEDRSLPSANSPLDLGLTAIDLLTDPLFNTSHGDLPSSNLHARLPQLTDGTAGNATLPVVGDLVSDQGPTTPSTARVGFAGQVAALNAQNATLSGALQRPIPLASYSSTITVNTLSDENNSGNNDATLSLREAIELVNGTLKVSQLSTAEAAQVSGTPGTNDLIQFDPTLFTNGPGTMVLTSALPALNTSITKANTVAIQGPGAVDLAISGAGKYQIFNLEYTKTTISGITLENGNAANGGAMRTGWYDYINNCTFVNNKATTDGGAVYEQPFGSHGIAAAHLNYDQFISNYAGAYGGAVENHFQVGYVNNCYFNKNSAGKEGGSLNADQRTVITGSTFLRSNAKFSSAIQGRGTWFMYSSTVMDSYNSSTYAIDGCRNCIDCTIADNQGLGVRMNSVFMVNTTIYGNANGGAEVIEGWIYNCTIVGNSNGGLISDQFGNAIVVVSNTIISGNSGGDITHNAIYTKSSYNNLVGSAGTSGLVNGTNGNIVGVTNVYLTKLQNNGGPTLTLAPYSKSQAIDHGDTPIVTNPNHISLFETMPGATQEEDQIGNPRIHNSTVDIGAVEYQGSDPGTPPAPTLSSLGRSSALEQSGSLTITINGSDFLPGSTAEWDGTSIATTFVSSTQLQATIPASDLVDEGTHQITVKDSAGTSATSLSFQVSDVGFTNVAAAANLSSTVGAGISNQQVASFTDTGSDGTGDYTVKVQFDDGSGTMSNGVNVSVQSLGGSNFAVFASTASNFAYQKQGNITFTVTINDSDGSATATVNGTVNVGPAPPPPSLSNLNQISASEMSGSITLQITGINFFAGSVALWDNTPLQTTINSTTQLTVYVPAADLTEEGQHTITVKDNFGTSASGLTFTVTDAGFASVKLATTPLVTVNFSLNNTRLATFVDPGTDGSTNDYTATVIFTDDLGVQHTVTGTVKALGGGQFGVYATTPFAYKHTGNFAFSVQINDIGGTTATVNGTIDVIQASGMFFIDGNNQLWMFFNGKFTNTGGFATKFSGGLDTNGNPECFFLDGNSQLWRYDNGKFTNLGAFATRLAAGGGTVAFTDGANGLWFYSDATGKFTNTGAFANQLVSGADSSGNNFFAFTDASNQVWERTSTGKMINTGAFGTQIQAGQDVAGNFEIWFTDGNNEIFRFDQGKNFTTGAFGSVIQASAGGIVYFLDGNHEIWSLTDAGVGTNTGAFGTRIAASGLSLGLFFTDGDNQIWELVNGKFTNTGGFTLKMSCF
jgi:hypothetical protein